VTFTRTVLFAAALAGGCGGGDSKVVVHGAITLDGKPLDGAQVQLVAMDAANLRAHVARTDAEGHFTIQSDAASGPIEPGMYVVLVLKYGSKDGKTGPTGETMGLPNIVPALYSDRGHTPNKVEIRAGTNELEPIKLESKKEQ